MAAKPETSEAEAPIRTVHPDRFYVVWSPQGGPPVVKHKSFHSARHAAYRLTARHPDREFYVLRTCWGRTPKTAEGAEG